jgi:hypothetical protein
MNSKDQELDLRNLDIITEVSAKGGKINDDTEESFEIWTITSGF